MQQPAIQQRAEDCYSLASRAEIIPSSRSTLSTQDAHWSVFTDSFAQSRDFDNFHRFSELVRERETDKETEEPKMVFETKDKNHNNNNQNHKNGNSTEGKGKEIP